MNGYVRVVNDIWFGVPSSQTLRLQVTIAPISHTHPNLVSYEILQNFLLARKQLQSTQLYEDNQIPGGAEVLLCTFIFLNPQGSDFLTTLTHPLSCCALLLN